MGHLFVILQSSVLVRESSASQESKLWYRYLYYFCGPLASQTIILKLKFGLELMNNAVGDFCVIYFFFLWPLWVNWSGVASSRDAEKLWCVKFISVHPVTMTWFSEPLRTPKVSSLPCNNKSCLSWGSRSWEVQILTHQLHLCEPWSLPPGLHLWSVPFTSCGHQRCISKEQL